MVKATHTPLRNVRIDDERWEWLGRAAQAEGSDRSALIRGMIDVYLEGLDDITPPPAQSEQPQR